MNKYRTQRAVLPSNGRHLWLVVDEKTLEPMPEARDFALYLSGAGKSDNTIRSYIPRVTGFLNWAHAMPGCDWKSVTLAQLVRFKWSLEAPRGGTGQDPNEIPRVRSAKTVNLTLTAVIEFLRYCGRAGLIDGSVAQRLVEPRFLAHMPTSFDAGERGQFRYARVKELKARELITPPKTLTGEQVSDVFKACSRERDLFLMVLLDATAMRIGEALGLRRSDMHFLPDSTGLGCEIPGAHVHVIRREDNLNGAYAKSLKSRHIPVTGPTALAYRDYQIERENVPTAGESDYVFVNLWGGQVGSPMTYSSTVNLVRRLGHRAGIRSFHAHLFRHTTATRWLDSGTPIDVVQELLGHASAGSTAVYAHTSDRKKREAVERVAKSLRKMS